MEIDIISLTPEYFKSPLEQSILKRALANGLLKIRQVDLRNFGIGKHKRVDDRPFGGGPGMLIKPEPLVAAVREVKSVSSHVIYLSPQGTKLTAKKSAELAVKDHLILVCGHYEGIDARVIELVVDEEISIGDYVLTNGALAALVLIDAMARYIPGVLGDERSVKEDSFEGKGGFDAPHYTHPRNFEGHCVPDVLLTGNHAAIEKWRYEVSLNKTKKVRPDLI